MNAISTALSTPARARGGTNASIYPSGASLCRDCDLALIFCKRRGPAVRRDCLLKNNSNLQKKIKISLDRGIGIDSRLASSHRCREQSLRNYNKQRTVNAYVTILDQRAGGGRRAPTCGRHAIKQNSSGTITTSNRYLRGKVTPGTK
ncbi:hypothetical protein EVAR_39847_1 [Eumeta japonica]|uniref:Uncharacterized protein n=1 Tax=Eumeta variegata TaxID=151549 RepID=A0A4C1WRV2_EUMVA|nr:hypothetical protein EVAR_39847_1 [Eumeta japonica]